MHFLNELRMNEWIIKKLYSDSEEETIIYNIYYIKRKTYTIYGNTVVATYFKKIWVKRKQNIKSS